MLEELKEEVFKANFQLVEYGLVVMSSSYVCEFS